MMKHNATEYLREWRRRAMSMVGALMIVGSALALTASAAAAAQACNPVLGSNTCLTIEFQGSNVYRVLVGIDVYMRQDEAQDIIALTPGGNPFFVAIMDDDGGGPLSDRVLFPVPIAPGWPRAGEVGLSAEFETLVSGSQLNGDNDSDEVYARVVLFDPRDRQTYILTSGVITDNFGPGTDPRPCGPGTSIPICP
jgi:hypothetical protein